jgi:hypothetical protein
MPDALQLILLLFHTDRLAPSSIRAFGFLVVSRGMLGGFNTEQFAEAGVLHAYFCCDRYNKSGDRRKGYDPC